MLKNTGVITFSTYVFIQNKADCIVVQRFALTHLGRFQKSCQLRGGSANAPS